MARTINKPKPPDYAKLLTRLVWVECDGRRLMRVERVRAGPRMGFQSIRAAGPSYEGRGPGGRDRWGWNGPVRTVAARDVKGVYFRRRTIPLDEFVR